MSTATALSVSGLTADHGTLVDNGNGTWTITPAANDNGPVSFSYNVHRRQRRQRRGDARASAWRR